MKIGTIGKLLIVFGVLGLLYALNMSVAMAGSNIVNLQMISERQNMFVVSGLLFISGIILFAVEKLKQTDEENTLERLQQVKSKEKTKQLLDKAVENSGHAKIKLPQLWRRTFIGFDAGWRSILMRLVFGLSLGKIASIFIPIFGRQVFDFYMYDSDWIWVLIVVYMFRNISILSVLKHIFILDLVLAMAICVSIFMEGETPTSAFYLILVFLLGGLFSVFVVQWKQSKK